MKQKYLQFSLNTTTQFIISTLCFILSISSIYAQNVGIGTATPNASAKLDISSTNSGILIPRMTTVQRTAIATPATGLLVFDNTSTSFWFYNGTTWIELKDGGGSPLIDADLDTKVDVEESPDEDIIRFDIAGTERWRMVNDRIEPSNSNGAIAIGYSALANNISRNIAIGTEALFANNGANSDLNIAIGDNSMRNLNGPSAYENTAVGTFTMSGIAVTGSGNAVFGIRSGSRISSGIGNTFMGGESGLNTSTGYQNVALGTNALYFNQVGIRNTMIGSAAGRSNTQSNNVMIGANAGDLNTGTGNVFLGYNVASTATHAGLSNHLFIDNSSTNTPLIWGNFASNTLRVNGIFQVNNPATTGFAFPLVDGTANQILQTNGAGQLAWANASVNTDAQDLALSGNTLSVTNDATTVDLSPYLDNTDAQATDVFQLNGNNLELSIANDGVATQTVNLSAFISDTLPAIKDTDGDTRIEVENTADDDVIRFKIGDGANQSTEFFTIDKGRIQTWNTNESVYIGESSGQNANYSNALGNTHVGRRSGMSNFSSNSNTGLGWGTLESNTAQGNTAIGAGALWKNTGGTLNCATGWGALQANVNSNNNSAFGAFALRNNVFGFSNTAIGTTSLNNNINGIENTAVGSEAGLNSLGSRNVFLGFSAGSAATGSDNLYIANSSTITPLIYGDFASDKLTVNNQLGIGGAPETTYDLTLRGTAGGHAIAMENAKIIAAKNSGGVYENFLFPRWFDDVTYLNYGSAGFNIRNNSNVSTMFMTNGGNVGIGTITPVNGKLEISGGASRAVPAVDYFSQGSAGVQVYGGGGTGLYSVWASDRVAASQFEAFSDRRIKNINGVSNSIEDLRALMQIEITDYTLIDSIGKGKKKFKKVIAQQVKEIYPQAINSNSTQIIPDIYQIAAIKSGWVQLETSLQSGDKVKIITKTEEKVYEVLETKNGAFKIDLMGLEQVFVFGREVYDFHTVDYEAISMLNVSATQELAKQLLAKNKALEDQLKALETTVKNIQVTVKNGFVAQGLK